MKSAPNHPRAGGFSLPELLTAMTLTLILAVIASSLLTTQQNALRHTRSRTELLDHQRQAADYLSRWLDRALGPVQVIEAARLPAPLAGSAVSQVIVLQAVTPDFEGLPQTKTHSFWVAYNDDNPWRPPFIRETRRSFRLMHRTDGNKPPPVEISPDDSTPWLTRHLFDDSATVVPAADTALALFAVEETPPMLTAVVADSTALARLSEAQRRALVEISRNASDPGSVINWCRAANVEAAAASCRLLAASSKARPPR